MGHRPAAPASQRMPGSSICACRRLLLPPPLRRTASLALSTRARHTATGTGQVSGRSGGLEAGRGSPPWRRLTAFCGARRRPRWISTSVVGGCCGESRSPRTRTMREDKSSRTKTKTQDKGQSKALYSTVHFSKVDPLYMRRSVSFYREAGGLFTFREHPRVKRIKTECARLSSGNLQLGLHVIGAP
jgi:hypothetical protein